MPSESDGNATPDPGAEARDSGQQQPNRRNRNRRPVTQTNNTSTRRFEGKCEALKNYVYDVSTVPNNYELFNTTTEAIGEYVATEYEYAGEYRRGLPDLNLTTLIAPANPNPLDMVSIEIWKLDVKDHRDKLRRRKGLNERVFGLVLGQCSRTVRDRIEAAAGWANINQSSDPMGLLALIRQSLFTGSTTRKGVHALIDAETALYKFKQSDRMTNSEYLEKVKGLVEVYEHFGGEPGVSAS
jgi:hypothetical protein